MGPLRSNPHVQLLRLLRTRTGADTRRIPLDINRGAPALVLETLEEEPWASLTFSGMRHCIELRLDGESGAVGSAFRDLSLWAKEPDDCLPGHFFAELQLTETEREIRDDGGMSLSLRLEALTIEE